MEGYTEVIRSFYGQLLLLGYSYPSLKFDGNSYWCETSLYQIIIWKVKNEGLVI